MTLSTALPPAAAPSRPAAGPLAAGSIAILIVAALAILILSLAGMTFIGLAIAFPIAVPAALELHLAVPAADIALAQRFADFAWLFGVIGFASLGAAAIVAFKAIEALSPAARD
jgi:hypothetical protein